MNCTLLAWNLSPRLLTTQVLPGQAYPSTLLLIFRSFSFSWNLFWSYSPTRGMIWTLLPLEVGYFSGAAFFPSVSSSHGSFACPHTSHDNLSHLKKARAQVYWILPLALISLQTSSHQASSKCFVEMRWKCWGRMSGKVFHVNRRGPWAQAVFSGRGGCVVTQRQRGPDLEAFPSGHSCPRNVWLPPPPPSQLG